MATLTGNKVKDSYQSLLKLSSGGATSTIKTVEDGLGVETALKVGTDTVEVNSLKITTTPTVSSSENTVMVYDDATNEVKVRELNTSAFQDVNSFSNIAVSGQTTVVADSGADTLTLVAGTGMTITTNETTDTITFASTASGGATTLSELTDTSFSSLSNSDLLVYDGTNWVNDSTPRALAFVDNSNAVNFVQPTSTGNVLLEAGNNMTITYSGNTISFASTASGGSAEIEETFIGRTLSDITLSATYQNIVFPAANNVDQSYHFGNTPQKLTRDASEGAYIENTSGGSILVHVECNAALETTSNNQDVYLKLQRYNGSSWVDIGEFFQYVQHSTGTGDATAMSFWGMFNVSASNRLQVLVKGDTSTKLKSGSLFKFTVKTIGNIV